jgi:hypothetical protein
VDQAYEAAAEQGCAAGVLGHDVEDSLGKGGGAGATGEATPWPAEVPLPVGETSGAPMTAVLTGTAAATATRTLPDGWHRYRTASGEPVRATWRYLLPDE